MMPVAGDLISWQANLLGQAVWIGTATALLAWVALRGVRDPRAVHAVAAAALLLIAATLLGVGIATWPEARPGPALIAAAPVAGGASVAPAVTQTDTVTLMPGSQEMRPGWRTWVVLAWCCGALVMALRHSVGWWRAVILQRTSAAIRGDIAERFTSLCARLGIAKPLLLANPRLAVPVAIGWWRPAVLVPTGLLAGLPPVYLDALLLHELAHLRRHDWVVEVAVSLLEGLLFFHPAVWWLGRRLRQAREQCCDSQAVHAGVQPDGLARALLAVAERIAPGSPALAASGGALADRVRRLLGLPARRERPWRSLAAIALLPLLLITVAACSRALAPAPPPPVRKATPPVSANPPVAYPLARRIRAHADGRQVKIKARVVAAPIAWWERLGLAGDAPRLLDGAQAAQVMAAVGAVPAAQVGIAATITVHPLQQGTASFISQFAYIADYEIRDGRPDPRLEILDWGHLVQVCAEPLAGGVILAEAHLLDTKLLGAETMSFAWQGDSTGQRYPLEAPVVLVEEGGLTPDTRLGPGDAVAIPLLPRLQRSRPEIIPAAAQLSIDQRIPDPDLSTCPRRICLLTAEVVGPPKIRLAAAPDATTWLDGTRVSLDLHDAPLDEAVRSLAAQLPVPVEVARDDDYASTRVTLSVRDAPARAVLGQLLGQCLLDGSATAGLLRLQADPAPGIPDPRHGQDVESGRGGWSPRVRVPK